MKALLSCQNTTKQASNKVLWTISLIRTLWLLYLSIHSGGQTCPTHQKLKTLNCVLISVPVLDFNPGGKPIWRKLLSSMLLFFYKGLKCQFERLLIPAYAAKWQTWPYYMAVHSVQLSEPPLMWVLMLFYLFVYACNVVIGLFSLWEHLQTDGNCNDGIHLKQVG